MRNRSDRVSVHKGGVRCDWLHTRRLHLCNVFPATGRWLLRRALKSCPVQMQERPDAVSDSPVCRNGAPVDVDLPDVSFVIGHRGRERLPLLLATLRSIAAQKDILFECIVVEQDEKPLIQVELPSWVRYIHAPCSESGVLYNRSLAFNEGARRAKGKVLILHDNDLLPPVQYAAESFRKYQDGYAVSQLKRFILYLVQSSTQQVCAPQASIAGSDCEQVLENACGGGSIAASAEAYWAIGGMDEEFVGWGGEDGEFWGRCQTLNVWAYGIFPMIHLWHASQPEKRDRDNPTVILLREKRSRSAEQRIERLKEKLNIEGGPAVQTDLVSTIIPVYNRAVFLGEAVESVLQQTYRPIEIVLVDDGSTDGTAEKVDEWALNYPNIVRVIHQKNGGAGMAREAGRLMARGEYIQYLDSDDLLLPHKFSDQVHALENSPDCGIAYGISSLVNEDREVIEAVYKDTGLEYEYLFPRLLVLRWWNTHTPLFRRSVTDVIGPWPAMRMSEDWVYDARAGALKIRLCHCPQIASLHRQHPGDRLTTQGMNPRVLADISKLIPELLRASQQAGVPINDPAMDHLARWSFLEARRCGAAGLLKEAIRLHGLSKSIAGNNRKLRLQLVIYRHLVSLLGWKAMGRMATKVNVARF
jgi:GT2 family glycosyltransferase